MAFVITFFAVILSLTVHEFMHASAAYLLGDMTAKREGRLTLNPISHIDPIGTLLLPLLLAASGLPGFGWAKPVPFNQYNLRDQKYGPFLVAIAGPLANFGIFFAATFALQGLSRVLPAQNLLLVFLFFLAIVNAGLGIFNLLPMPPLDGSKVLYIFERHTWIRRFVAFMERYGFFVLMIYIFIGAPGLSQMYAALLDAAGLVPYFLVYQKMF